jgi:hypothetical protein
MQYTLKNVIFVIKDWCFTAKNLNVTFFKMQEINYTIQLSAHMYHCLCIEFILHKNGMGINCF